MLAFVAFICKTILFTTGIVKSQFLKFFSAIAEDLDCPKTRPLVLNRVTFWATKK